MSQLLLNSVSLAIICSTINGQCDRYVIPKLVNNSGLGFINYNFIYEILDVAVDKCLPTFQNFSVMMHYEYSTVTLNGSSRGYSANMKRTRPRYGYSDCNFNVNISIAKECEELNCFERSDFTESISSNSNDLCEYAPNSGVYYVSYGYYEDICNLSGTPLLYQWECKCNNTYRLIFYGYDGNNRNCKLETFLFANETNIQVINCSHNDCASMDNFVFERMDHALTNDYECTNQCIVDSKFNITEITTTQADEISSNTTFTESDELYGDQWFIIGIVFICLFVIALILSVYLCHNVWKKNHSKVGEGKYNAVTAQETDAA